MRATPNRALRARPAITEKEGELIMTGILKKEVTALMTEIAFELKLLCYNQKISFKKIQGEGSIDPSKYERPLGIHRCWSVDTSQSFDLSETGEVGIQCNRLTRLKNASSYKYLLEADSSIKFSFD